MKPCLVIERGESRGAVRRLDRRSVVAGRDLSCGLWLPDASLRPRHAEFTLRDGRWFVRALDEHAPLRINDLSAREAALSPGDRVHLGDDVTLSFEMRASSSRRALVLILGVIVAITAAFFALRHRGGSRTAPDTSTPAPIAPTSEATRPPEPDARQISEMEALSRRLEQSVPETPGARINEPEAPVVKSAGGIPESTGISNVHDELTSALAAVQSLIAEGSYDLAVTRAKALLKANPDALPAWAALAGAEESASNLPGAEAAWRQILMRSDSGEWYDRAAQEMSRLTTLQMNSAPPEVPTPVTVFPEEPPLPPELLRAPLVVPGAPESTPPAPRPAEPAAHVVPPVAPTPPAAVVRPTPAPAVHPKPAVTAPVKAPVEQHIYRPVVRIANVQMRRFPPSDRGGEQRILEVQLERSLDAKWIRPDHIHVAVEFFDQTPGGSPTPTRAKISPSPMTPATDAWNNASTSVNFSYQSDASSNAPFYGYRVRVFYDNMLQDSSSKPDALER